MPLYEYQCDKCAHRFEVIQKYSDPPIEVCPKCGGHVSKLLSSPAIQFKGSGWYVTDYGKGGSSGSSSSSSESKNESKSESKAETKTETKAETKSETKSDAKPSGSSS